MTGALIFLFIARCCDIATTMYGLRTGVVKEGNPVVAFQMKLAGKYWGLLNLAITMGIGFYLATLGLELYINLFALLSLCVAVWNLALIRRLKR